MAAERVMSRRRSAQAFNHAIGADADLGWRFPIRATVAKKEPAGAAGEDLARRPSLVVAVIPLDEIGVHCRPRPESASSQVRVARRSGLVNARTNVRPARRSRSRSASRSPSSARGRSVRPVCRPLALQSVWPWRTRKTFGSMRFPMALVEHYPHTGQRGDRRRGGPKGTAPPRPSTPSPHIVARRVADRLQLAFARLAGRDFLGRLGGRPSAIQSGHQEPGVSLAAATQDSKSPSSGPSVQNWYFGLPAGLTTPAIWPEPASTKRTGPPKHFAPLNTAAGRGDVVLPRRELVDRDRHLRRGRSSCRRAPCARSTGRSGNSSGAGRTCGWRRACASSRSSTPGGRRASALCP